VETADSAHVEAAADFARRFQEYWRAPTPGGLEAILAPDVRLVAPMTRTTTDLAGGKRAFAELLGLIPDLRAEVSRWGASTDGLFIEFTMSGTAGGRPISWRAVDRFVLDDGGLATERISYFDSAAIARVLARRPRAWPAFVRSRIRRP
jgi:hypothetical protein